MMYRLIEADHYINKKILVVGGGDGAVEAAMGLAEQPGNRVTISYRREAFSRIKERNARRIEEGRSTGKIEVLFQSNPAEFKATFVVLTVAGQSRNLPNDFVWIFAGGEPPNALLKQIGVGSGARDMTLEGSQKAGAEAETNLSMA